jgi:hypothetical protein
MHAPLPADLRDFFDRYRNAFQALDGAAVAALYAVPSAIAQDGALTVWTGREAIAANMAALCALYRERGWRSASYEVAQWWPQGDAYAVADLRWCIAWQGDAPPWIFHTTYNLVRGEAGWRVLLCTAYDEPARFRG